MSDPHTLPRPDQLTLRATRDGFGDAIVELGGKSQRVCALTADLQSSMKLQEFARLYPERYIECGVAEQNMMGIAAGLALEGMIPFVCSFAVFSPGRNWDQLRVSVCYQRSNVKIIGGHTGLATGLDGATHQALEDIALTQVLPHLTVLSPCDALETKKAVQMAAMMEGPVYIRVSRHPTPLLTVPETDFRIGTGRLVASGEDITLLSTGPLLYETLIAREMLENERISTEVIHLHTLKPVDSEMIVKSIRRTGGAVTIEDHQIAGGLGSIVATLLARQQPAPLEFIGVHDQFGQSGTAKDLYEFYGLSAPHIVRAAKKVLAQKKSKNR